MPRENRQQTLPRGDWSKIGRLERRTVKYNDQSLLFSERNTVSDATVKYSLLQGDRTGTYPVAPGLIRLNQAFVWVIIEASFMLSYSRWSSQSRLEI